MIRRILLFLAGLATVLLLCAAPALFNRYRKQVDEQPSWSRPLQANDQNVSWMQTYIIWIEFGVLGFAGIAGGVRFLLWAAERRIRATEVGGHETERPSLTRHRTIADTAQGPTSSHVYLRHRRGPQQRFSDTGARIWVAIFATLAMLFGMGVIALIMLVNFEPGTGGTNIPQPEASRERELIFGPFTGEAGTTSYSLPEASSGPQPAPAEIEQNRRDLDELIRRSKEAHPTKYF